MRLSSSLFDCPLVSIRLVSFPHVLSPQLEEGSGRVFVLEHATFSEIRAQFRVSDNSVYCGLDPAKISTGEVVTRFSAVSDWSGGVPTILLYWHHVHNAAPPTLSFACAHRALRRVVLAVRGDPPASSVNPLTDYYL